MPGDSKPSVIFHVPYSLDVAATSASIVRPRKLIDALIASGFDVTVISGSVADRARLVREVVGRLNRGWKPLYCYSEAAALPTRLAGRAQGEGLRLLNPDFRLFRRLKRQAIPLGLFYRDAVWLESGFMSSQPGLVRSLIRKLYLSDLRLYRRTVSHMFFPTRHLRSLPELQLGLPASELPPAGEARELTPATEESSTGYSSLSLLYIGNLGGHYRLHELTKAVTNERQVTLTLCVPRIAWEREEANYVTSENVQVRHYSGAETESLLATAMVAMAFFEPHPYMSKALSLKIFEYMSWGLPMIAARDTLAGEFIEEHGLGWVIDYDQQELQDLMRTLASNPQLVAQARERVRTARVEHTWERRAQQLHSELLNG